MNCNDCRFWKNHDTIEDVYYEIGVSIPVVWKLCANPMVHSSFNMFLADKELEALVIDVKDNYYGFDKDGICRKYPKYMYLTSENFGCVFGEKLNTEME